MTRLRLIAVLGTISLAGCSAAGDPRADRPLVRTYSPGLEASWDGELPILASATRGPTANATAERITAAVDSYEDWFWRRTGVTDVVLCSELSVGGEPVPAARVQLTRGPQTARLVLLNVPEEEVPEWYVERVMHHELFHVFEKRVFPGDYVWGVMFNEYAGEAILRRWLSRREGFVDILRLEKAREEFVSIYAQVSGEEDRAEVFSMLKVFPAAVEAKALRNTQLGLKVWTIKSMLEIAEQQEGYPGDQIGSGSDAR